MTSDQLGWYSVRTIYQAAVGRFDDIDTPIYEERLTLWQADNFDAAIALAETEAAEYAESVDCEYIGLAQAYQLSDPPGHGEEVYSLMRASTLAPNDYLDAFFDTGTERQSPA